MTAEEGVNAEDVSQSTPAAKPHDGSPASSDATKLDEGPPPSNQPAPVENQLKFFVGGLHPTVDDVAISDHFSKYGRIVSAQVMRDFQTGRSRGFGFVTLVVQENTDDVFKDEHTLGGRRVDVRHMQNDPGATIKRKIFVGGISKALSEQMLEDYFGRFGAIEKVIIMRQIDGSSRGFGFVVFSVDGATEKVLESPSHFVYGTKVDVRAAESRSKQAAHRHDSYYKSLAQHSYRQSDNDGGRHPPFHHPPVPLVPPHKMPPAAAPPMVGYDPQILQQHMLYQQYAMQTQYAYYAQQAGAHGPKDPSRYSPYRPTNFGNQPNSQNNIARSYRPKPY
ncbi:RNA recognition motif-containing protein [Babesia caballi]|uniref:RNA recognition motif-containing protein n=1 Tax=Babesia caballi TaxID=5871 RepID=A0AAV4LR63_BABCB|nr:RNA recognition motif-containing protein [Babesia caballi]